MKGGTADRAYLRLIEGQVGESVVDYIGKRVIVNIASDGRSLATPYHVGKAWGCGRFHHDAYDHDGWREYDFSRRVRIDVSTFGRTDEWTIYVERVEMLVNTDRVDAWSRVIWAYGSCPSDMSGGFQYRKASDTEWIDVPTSGVTQTSGAVVGCIKHLATYGYVVRRLWLQLISVMR